jgi:hypothetical protein
VLEREREKKEEGMRGGGGVGRCGAREKLLEIYFKIKRKLEIKSPKQYSE